MLLVCPVVFRLDEVRPGLQLVVQVVTINQTVR